MSRTVKRGILNQTHDRVFDAVVVDVVRDRCSVRLAGNGQVLRGLRYSGGPLEAGDKCKVSYASGSPIVMGMGRGSTITVKRNPARTRLARPDYSGGQLGTAVAAHGHPEIRIVSSDGSMQFYDATADGLAEAEAAQVSGDLIVIPETTTITFATFTLAANVDLAGADRFSSILAGKVVLSNDTTLRNLTVTLTGSTAGDVVAIEMTGSNLALILNCDIFAENTGAGNAYAIAIKGDATSRVVPRDCYLRATADLGDARIFYSAVANNDAEVDYSTFDNTGRLDDVPDAGWKIAAGLTARVHCCGWHDGYTPDEGEVFYRAGDRAALDQAGGESGTVSPSVRVYMNQTFM